MSIATASASSAIYLTDSASDRPSRSTLPKSAISVRQASMNLGGSTSGPSSVFRPSKLSSIASFGSKARRSSFSRVSPSSHRNRARRSFFSGSFSPTRLSISSRQRFARRRISSAAGAAPAASACCRFASSSSTSGASRFPVAASSVTFCIIFSGAPARNTLWRRAAADSSLLAASALTASTTLPYAAGSDSRLASASVSNE
mmetsp:Transcript_16074/g.50388  ORF Transcript_16074/g.50388 Transcript_16074/m.50388 type:complete len:202 (-) Transcript_16074:611-1216(-)